MPTYEGLRFFLDGMLYMMALYSVLSYLQQRKAIYWQYAIYIVCITYTFHLNDLDYKNVEYLPGTNFAITVLESVAFAMYISFAIQLIGIRENDPRSYRIMRWMIIVLAVETVVDGLIFLYEASDEIKSWSYTLFRYILAAGALVVVPRLLRLRQPVVSYFITGSLVFVTGSLIALSINYIPAIFIRSAEHPFSFPVTYMELGVVGEVLCFTLGMSLRNRENELEKIRVQQELIEQLRENEKKQQKIMQIRDDIARDLHDELGGDLSSISMVSHAALHQMNTTPELARQSLRQIGETARKVVRVMREIVWSLHSSHDASDQFAIQLRETALTLFEHHPIQLHFDFGNEVAPVPAFVRRDLLLIYKELMHNTLRHAGAKNIYIYFKASPHSIELTVQDDGQGFDVSADLSGHGLMSLRQRANSLNGHLTMHSNATEGTRTTFTCPLVEEYT
jgi:signal transduction histidine kinase